MCSIDKLLIKGVRSFSPSNQHVIEFYRPLTLIVGQNGAGKTTVIECLKQACTGELPPNVRSGQGFIHDPKVAGEPEVKAQIKLRIRTAQGAPIVIVRSFQLVQKAKALQFKTLDQVLQTMNQETGVKEAISYRCTDIDRLVPRLMGVSKAVLENVIFVHQEDSNWPLAEGLVLKKKFDDIFAATKYTKALEVLRKLRSEKTAEIKQLKLQLDHLKTHKDTATRLRTDIEGGNARITELDADIQACNEQILMHQEKADDANDKLSAVSDLHNKAENLKIKQQTLAKQNGEAYARFLSRWNEGDDDEATEQLQTYLDMADQELQNNQAKLRSAQREAHNQRGKLNGLEGQYAQDSQRRDRLQAQKEQHARLVQDRDRAVRRAGVDLGIQIAGGEGALSDEALRAFDTAFSGRMEELRAQMQQAKNVNRNAEEQMSARLDGVNGEMAGINEAIRQKQQQLDAFEERKAAIDQQIATCNVKRVDIRRAEEREEETSKAAKTAEANLHDINQTAQLATLDTDLQGIANTTRRLREERNRLSSASEAATRVKLKRQEVEAKEEELEDLLRSHRTRLLSVLGANELPESMKQLRAAVDQAVEARKAALDAARKVAQDASHAAASNKATAQSAKQALDALEQEHAAATARLTSGLRAATSTQTQRETQTTQEAELPQRIEWKQHELDAEANSLQTCVAYRRMVDAYKTEAQENRRCHTCERPFEDDAAIATFIARQDQESNDLPNRIQRLKGLQDGIRQQLAALRKLEPLHLRLQTLTHELLPAAQQTAEDADAAFERSERRANELQTGVSDAERALQEAQAGAHNAAWPAAGLELDMQALQEDIATETRQQAAAGAGRTVIDVDRDLEEQEAHRSAKQITRDQLLARVNDLRDEVTASTNAWHDAREQLNRVKTLAERKSSLSSQRAELEKGNAAAAADIERELERKPSLQAQQQQLMGERDQQRKAGAEREAAVEEKQHAIRQQQALLQSLQDQVDAYTQQDIAGQLARVEETLGVSQQKQEECRKQLGELEASITGHQEAIRSSEEVRAQVTELLALRRSKAEEEAVFKEMEQLRAQVGEVDVPGLQRQFNDNRQQVVEARSRRDTMTGALNTVRDNVAIARRDLGAVQFHDIDVKFRTQTIRTNTTIMATSDLEKYHKALEKALLAFHTTKMTDINKTIKELWQKTYRNQDIDYIQVKADSEGAGARSYNYRVIMVAGGAELDMRGRCSAGQKVLACLIIRLALAETFCLNCGILALDEPTTNLDAANAASLATGLRAIIDTRRQQQNFQLVVITHDENFASLIGTREHADHMWRITKDENQHTHIAQEDIAG